MVELADIFFRHGPEYLDRFANRMLPSHIRAMHDIVNCRTALMGGRVYQCQNPDCQKHLFSYHSCGNRNCPKCGQDRTEQWLKKQHELLLPTHYFLVIDRESGSFGHTCVHLAIADLAKTYEIPVFVIADTSKIGDLKWEADLFRDIKWLPNYREYEEIFTKSNLINPREDTVESDKISIIITEKGPKLPQEIKKLVGKNS